MKRLLLLIVHVILLICFSIALNAQQVFKATPTSVIPYLEYLPQNYSSNSDKYPVVFFLHGIGERGPNSTDLAILEKGVWTITKNGPPKLVKYGQQFPFILISIQLKNNFGTWPTWYVLEVIEHVKSYLRIDERRVHISGLSLGGGGTWTMAQTYPQLFATASPVCGGYNSPSSACAIAAENLPVWAFHGDADTVVPYSKTVNMVNAINACQPAPSPAAKVTIYPGLNHNVWDRAYTADNTWHNPNLYQWMMPYINKINKGNRIPEVNTGADKTITSKSVTLTATALDDGSIVSWKWSKISGGSATMTNAASSALSLSGLAVGKYMFRCTATDNAGASDTDYVQVVVQNAPVANAGPDVTVTLPTSSTNLTGSATDSDGTISSYKWTFVSGPKTPVLTNAASAVVSVSSLTTEGSYVFQLEVKDNLGGIGRDRATVYVKGTSSTPLTTTNQAPIVNAGLDVTVFQPSSSAKLTGSAIDADGTIASYTWTQVSGPIPATMTGSSTPTVTITGMTTAGFYVFKLTAKDNKGAIGYDKVAVTVKAPVTASGTDAIEVREIRVVDLADDGDAYWADKKVLIYSETGSQIYSGAWSENSFERVLSKGGLFIYNVLEGNRRVLAGKISVQ